MEFNSYFYNDLKKAIKKKQEYDEQMKYICNHMMNIAPYNNRWYYNNTGFLQVDVHREDYDEYLDFMENIVGCSYCHALNENGITLMVSLNTLLKELEKQKKDFF